MLEESSSLVVVGYIAALHFLQRLQQVGALLIIEFINADVSLLDFQNRSYDLFLRLLGQDGHPLDQILQYLVHRRLLLSARALRLRNGDQHTTTAPPRRSRIARRWRGA
jgi:hypothetical protein